MLADESMPALANSARELFEKLRAPLFVVFYLGLAVVMWEGVRITKLRELIWQASQNTMRITAMVLFILIGSTIFVLVFRGVDGDPFIEHLLSHLPGGAVGFLIFVNLFVFFCIDFFEIAFIIVRCLRRWRRMGIDLIWFGVLLCVFMQTSFMHPPFGFALFYLRSIAPKEIRTGNLLGRDSVGRAAAHHGGDRDRLAGAGDLHARQAERRGPDHHQIETPQTDFKPGRRKKSEERSADFGAKNSQRNKKPRRGGVFFPES
jgi:hypothetical protein